MTRRLRLSDIRVWILCWGSFARQLTWVIPWIHILDRGNQFFRCVDLRARQLCRISTLPHQRRLSDNLGSSACASQPNIVTQRSNSKGPILGVDVGGTKVAVGLVDLRGRILAEARQPMLANGMAEAALGAVTGAIDSVLSAASNGVQSIGICAPGPLDPRAGMVLNPPISV